MELKNLTPKDIENMNYNQLIGIVKETNRIPGGRNTILEIINKLCLTKQSKILEIGTSTGFTSIEISRFLKCQIIAIDINDQSLEEARKRALDLDYNNINFINADINNLPFKDNDFDLVIVGNILSLLTNKDKSLNECRRVCKKEGFILAVPMYYIKSPPEEIVSKVSEAIGTEIKIWDKEFWTSLFEQISEDYGTKIELYYSKDFVYKDRNKFIDDYVGIVLNKNSLKGLSEEMKKKTKEKYSGFMRLFNENLKYAGFSILLYQKRNIKDEMELFLTKEK